MTGPLSKLLSTCESLTVVKFQAIRMSLKPSHISDANDLSTDQMYLFDITNAISEGFCTKSLLARKPCKLNKSRWLTTANRFSRLYVSTKNPSKELLIRINFIMEVYEPTWFNIKYYNACTDGTRNLLYIKLTRYLEEKAKDIVDKVIM